MTTPTLRVSQLIARLQAILDEHGDLEVFHDRCYSGDIDDNDVLYDAELKDESYGSCPAFCADDTRESKKWVRLD